MSRDKEDEQLLQDASTLLMLANVAARQVSPLQSPADTPLARNMPAINSTARGKSPQLTPPITPKYAPLDSRQDAPHMQRFYQPQLAAPNRPFYPYAYTGSRLPPLGSFKDVRPDLNKEDSRERDRKAGAGHKVGHVLGSEGHVKPPLILPHPPSNANHKTPNTVKSEPQDNTNGKTNGVKDDMLKKMNRGINVESRKRHNDNVVFAAAALAQAADIPLPLRKPEPEKKKRKKEELNGELKPGNEKIKEENKIDKPKENGTNEGIKRETNEETNKEVSAPAVPVSGLINAPNLESIRVDPDSGIIGCICGIEEDDGFTIQCDLCFRWQHCNCMGFKTNEEVPEDEYQCYLCDPAKNNKFDAESCRKDTALRLEAEKEEKQKKEKRRRSETKEKNEKRKSTAAGLPVLSSLGVLLVPNLENELLEGGVTAEAYQGVYYRLRGNDYKTPEIKARLEKLDLQNLGIEVLSQTQFKQIKFSKLILPNYQKYMEGKGIKPERAKTYVQVKPYIESTKQRFTGISKLGLFISAQGECVIPEGTLVIEYLGEIDSFELYAKNPTNQYGKLGTPKPRVLKVDLPGLSIVVDTRFVGSEARFIRNLCPETANCVVKPVFVSQLKAFKFVVVTTRPIELKEQLEEELRLPWQWDAAHPICNDSRGEVLTEREKVLFSQSVDLLCGYAECACPAPCLLKTKKPRTKRVLPDEAPETRVYILWKERLLLRDRECVEDEPEKPAAPLRDRSGFFQIPFRQQRVPELARGYPAATPLSLAVPLVPDVLAEIRKQVTVAFEPAQPQPPAPAAEPARTVKKLSFADYKKKMR